MKLEVTFPLFCICNYCCIKDRGFDTLNLNMRSFRGWQGLVALHKLGIVMFLIDANPYTDSFT